ncbi:MAG: Flp pilus assembly complex ATPase component TadA [Anaerolineae bacterium]|nr:Flp pilus assembly complex ATPase component TadA [Anaerolineae bacterium]
MPDQPDSPSNGQAEPGWRQPRRDADKGREPRLFSSQLGSRWVSLSALVEQIEAAFLDEHGDDSMALRQAETKAQRLALIRETTDYVLAVESVQVSRDEKAELIRQAFSSLFGYGALDGLLTDDRVTTISLEGPDKVSVRYGHGELIPLGPIFQTVEQFERVVRRLLADAGASYHPDQPFLEFGLMAGERPIGVNLVAPPLIYQLTVDIRLHPRQALTLEALAGQAFLSDEALQVLLALTRSPHGIMVIGDPESGKTTLLNALLLALPETASITAVERAGEMRLPERVQRLRTQWPVGEQPGATFGEQIRRALNDKPQVLILDEVRSDEPGTIAPLLQMDDPPRQIWSFRGAIFTKRLQNALGMLARRADPSAGEMVVQSLYRRLPFVVTVNRVAEQLRLWSIGEWQFRHSPDYPTYTPLMQTEEGRLRPSGELPQNSVDLPDSFWNRGG